MPLTPPSDLVDVIEREIRQLLTTNPAATESESFLQHSVEFALLNEPVDPRYLLRIGINYHGQKVQQLVVDAATGVLNGWNRQGDALKTGADAKLRLAGHTIFDRNPGEQMMSDSKVGGGSIPAGGHIRIEFKVRGWLGKTRNLDGKQMLKDMHLLRDDKADLLVVSLSETAHRKWRGEGPAHQAGRRTGCTDFCQILMPPADFTGDAQSKTIQIYGQSWNVYFFRVTAADDSIMPGAEHFVTMCWR